MARVSIITVNFRQDHHTIALLDSLSQITHQDMEVIIVENGWRTDLDEAYKAVYPSVKIIHSYENLGFAGGNNLGIKAATGDYLFFLNNDTVIPPDTVEKLVGYMEQNRSTGVICPRIYYFDQPEMIQYAGFTPMNWYTGQNHAALYGKSEKPADRVVSTAFAHGAAMMISREAINSTGLMPEQYFLYYEELDWIQQMRERGFMVKIHHGACILHKESVSTGKASALKTFFQTRNRILFIRRNAGARKWIFFLFFGLAVFPKHLFTYLLTRKWEHAKALVAGTYWNLKHSTTSAVIGHGFDKLRNV